MIPTDIEKRREQQEDIAGTLRTLATREATLNGASMSWIRDSQGTTSEFCFTARAASEVGLIQGSNNTRVGVDEFSLLANEKNNHSARHDDATPQQPGNASPRVFSVRIFRP